MRTKDNMGVVTAPHSVWVGSHTRSGKFIDGYWRAPVKKNARVTITTPIDHTKRSKTRNQQPSLKKSSKRANNTVTNTTDKMAKRPEIRDYALDGVKFRVDDATPRGKSIVNAFSSVAQHVHANDKSTFKWLEDNDSINAINDDITRERHAMDNLARSAASKHSDRNVITASSGSHAKDDRSTVSTEDGIAYSENIRLITGRISVLEEERDNLVHDVVRDHMDEIINILTIRKVQHPDQVDILKEMIRN